jgi:hypothetical protein
MRSTRRIMRAVPTQLVGDVHQTRARVRDDMFRPATHPARTFTHPLRDFHPTVADASPILRWHAPRLRDASPIMRGVFQTPRMDLVAR